MGAMAAGSRDGERWAVAKARQADGDGMEVRSGREESGGRRSSRPGTAGSSDQPKPG
ncbi:unnamed protein product [Spirodela intermedia]|uniref:Uncharacterized protein n=1 Tax=Spirodela intermedia TaxID=51605 RepID=A0A7I8IQD6_SPIIN|nr:unnamed protein product [Spirodela intermedia]CAA6660119.1 unnamed protein product [Spirodela intermedia]